MDTDPFAHRFYTALVYEIASDFYAEDPEEETWMARSKNEGYSPPCIETEVTFVSQFVGAVPRKSHVRLLASYVPFRSAKEGIKW